MTIVSWVTKDHQFIIFASFFLYNDFWHSENIMVASSKSQAQSRL